MAVTYDFVLIAIVVFSYVLVMVVTFRSKGITSELEGLVRDLKLKEVNMIKTSVAPPSKVVQQPPSQRIPRPQQIIQLQPPHASRQPQRRVVHEKVEVTRQRRVEESVPGEVQESGSTPTPPIETEVTPVTIMEEEPIIVEKRTVETPQRHEAAFPSSVFDFVKIAAMPQQPPPQRQEAKVPEPVLDTAGRGLKSQLLSERGDRLKNTLDESYKRGMISKKTYEELLKRTGQSGTETASVEKLEPPSETRQKVISLIDVLRRQYESGIISYETYTRSRQKAESKLK